jgi:hypothetical protein
LSAVPIATPIENNVKTTATTKTISKSGRTARQTVPGIR